MTSRILVTVIVLLLSSVAFAKERMTFIYYYGWYGNPAYDLEWLHWNEMDHEPPWDIAASYYPKLGAYSSQDPAVLDIHMRWISGAGVDALIYSWWGEDDPTHEVAYGVLDVAARYGLKVAFLIEPYEGRTTRSMCRDVEVLNREFGEHPAFLRLVRTTKYGVNPAPRGVIFIYDPQYPDPQLQKLSDNVHQSSYDSILLYQSTDASLIERTHADGIFSYEAVLDIMHFYAGIQKAVREQQAIFIPNVSPGFNVRRYFDGTSSLLKRRKRGQTYDEWWEHTIAADPEFIAILSFNEWHEGTQIEPAIRVRSGDPPYLSYEKAYNKKGVPAQFSYLKRTARWIKLFLQLP